LSTQTTRATAGASTEKLANGAGHNPTDQSAALVKKRVASAKHKPTRSPKRKEALKAARTEVPVINDN
jgi:hypothetical protein